MIIVETPSLGNYINNAGQAWPFTHFITSPGTLPLSSAQHIINEGRRHKRFFQPRHLSFQQPNLNRRESVEQWPVGLSQNTLVYKHFRYAKRIASSHFVSQSSTSIHSTCSSLTLFSPTLFKHNAPGTLAPRLYNQLKLVPPLLTTPPIREKTRLGLIHTPVSPSALSSPLQSSVSTPLRTLTAAAASV